MKPVLAARWFTDPFCSWSYAAEEAIRSFRAHFGERVAFSHHMMVLYRDLPSFLTKHHLNRPRDFAPRIRDVSRETGVPINDGSWESEQVPASTETCCLFVRAAIGIDPVLGDRLLSRIRKLAFVDGRNIGETGLLFDAATEEGFDRNTLEQAFRDPGASLELDRDAVMAREEGVTVRPTLILTNPGGDRVFVGGLRNAELFILAGEALIAEAS